MSWPNDTLCLSLHSLAENDLTNLGKDISGVLKLAEMLPQTKIESLKCAAAERMSQECDIARYIPTLCTH